MRYSSIPCDSPPANALRRILITPQRPSVRQQLVDFWEFRELLFFFVWRNLKVRYAQTILGASWAILQPVLTSSILALILGRFAGMPSDGAPHFLFYMAALVPWTFFAGAVTGASNSLVSNQNLLVKVYFPRLFLPLAAVVGSLVDVAIGVLCLVGTMALWGIIPGPSAALVLPLLLSAAMTAVGLGAGLAALNLKFRDVAHAVPFMIQILLYTSPVLYSVTVVPPSFRDFFSLNPMVGVIEGFRAVLLGTRDFSLGLTLVSLGMGSAVLTLGMLYFTRVERRFADFA